MNIGVNLGIYAKEDAIAESLGYTYNRQVFNGIISFALSKSDVKLKILSPAFAEKEELDCIDGIIGRSRQGNFTSRLGEIPVVNVASKQLNGVYQVCCDNAEIAKMAFDYLFSCNLRSFAFLHVPRSINSGQRRDEFTKVCIEMGFVPHIVDPGRTDEATDRRKRLDSQLKALPKPTGLLLARDNQAESIFEACDRLGIRVPEDLAILGTDNYQGVCLSTSPTLSSIDINGLQVGYMAAETIYNLLNGEDMPECQLVPPRELVERGSTTSIKRLSPGVAAVVDFIHAHLGDPITMEDLVPEQGLSRRSLEMAFNAELGQSPMHYLQELRLERVAALLMNTDLNVSAIGRQCGFRRLNYLCRVFKKRHGKTPLAYRKAALKK